MSKGSNRLTGGGGAAVKTTRYFTGQPSQRVNPGGADQLGQSMGNHSTSSGRTLRNPATPLHGGAMRSPKLGNECAVRTVAGPGGSRTINATGGQGQHGPVAGSPKPSGRDILGEYGPESPNVAGRR